MSSRISNKEFAAQDKKFQAACKAAGVEPTARQASKYRNNQGLAYQSKGMKNNV